MGSKKHGQYLTSTYNVWKCMRKRCNNQNDPFYHRYGERGIEVCARWDNYENFYSDMGAQPEGKKLDRIDNDGDYRPENCRWVTQQKQNYNMSTNHNVIINGISKCIAEWAKIAGISTGAMRHRVKAGWLENKLLNPSTAGMNKPNN